MSESSSTPDVETLLAQVDWLRAIARSLVSDRATADDIVAIFEERERALDRHRPARVVRDRNAGHALAPGIARGPENVVNRGLEPQAGPRAGRVRGAAVQAAPSKDAAQPANGRIERADSGGHRGLNP